ncbi:MAG: hypothetical protein JJ971_11925 [Balneolaceae bacterium]|nr:hypothetical protein [Balneolaceae bacterium]MBO6547441.1 hypothetical protein [Balneolaceae bacterium]MBO6647612.1 hypothetical protein [Balneolaceae bacterium]
MDDKEKIVANKALFDFEEDYNSKELKRNKNLDCFEPSSSAYFPKIESKKFNEEETVVYEVNTDCDIPDAYIIDNTRDNPFKMICKIVTGIEGLLSKVGTGFFISPRCIITAGHNLHWNTVYGDKWVEVAKIIPGSRDRTLTDNDEEPFGVAYSEVFRSVSGFVNFGIDSYDYGAIILHDCSLFNRINKQFDYGLIKREKRIYHCGYRNAGRYSGNMSLNEGDLLQNNKFTIDYNFDVSNGNSGGPTFIERKKETFKVIGVHTQKKERCTQESIKIRKKVIEKFNIWTNIR